MPRATSCVASRLLEGRGAERRYRVTRLRDRAVAGASTQLVSTASPTAIARAPASPPSRPPLSLPIGAAFRLTFAALRAMRSDGQRFDPDRLDRRDPAFIAEIERDLGAIARGWLRLVVSGEEHLSTAPCLYVANHNGGIMGPDLFCTMHVLWRALGADAPLYAMAHDFAMRHIHPLGRMLQRLGAMRADPVNAHRALERGGSVLVYPGGDLDAFRHSRRRNEIVFGTRTGFVRIARERGVPIVPIVAHGAHRSAWIFHEGEWLARALGLTRWSRLQRFPLALALPWGIAPGPWMPYAPLPFPIRLRVLPPIRIERTVPLDVVRDDVVRRMQHAMDAMSQESA